MWDDGRRRTPLSMRELSFFFFFFKDEQESRFHEKIPSPCTNCTTVLLDAAQPRYQLTVLSVTQAGVEGGLYEFRFFSFVVKVSYFVQLQSWSLKDGNGGVSKRQPRICNVLKCKYILISEFLISFGCELQTVSFYRVLITLHNDHHY